MQTLQNSDMYQNILSLEKIDAKDISNFMSSPVNIKTDVLYEVENYGTGMTPFYTNLALWVGGLILVSILKQEVDRDKEVPDFTPTSAYFGRILLFLIIGLIQGVIVCAGDIILLKVQCLQIRVNFLQFLIHLTHNIARLRKYFGAAVQCRF